MTLCFSDEEVADLKSIVCVYVSDGHETPPYDAALYALFAKLGITQADVVPWYDITPPAPPEAAAPKA